MNTFKNSLSVLDRHFLLIEGRPVALGFIILENYNTIIIIDCYE